MFTIDKTMCLKKLASKVTKVCFKVQQIKRYSIDIPPLELNGKEIKRVHQSKLLGIVISDDLGWDAH